MEKRFIFWVEFEPSNLPVLELKLEFNVPTIGIATGRMFEYVSQYMSPLVIKRFSTFVYEK